MQGVQLAKMVGSIPTRSPKVKHAMDRVVTYELFGEERKVVIHGASSDAQARDLFATELAKFRITNIVGVNAKPNPKTSIWSLMADGFRFPKLSKNVQPTQ